MATSERFAARRLAAAFSFNPRSKFVCWLKCYREGGRRRQSVANQQLFFESPVFPKGNSFVDPYGVSRFYVMPAG